VPRPIIRGFSTGKTVQAEMAAQLPAPEDLTVTANVEIRWVFEADR
jgi:hypothetical protein